MFTAVVLIILYLAGVPVAAGPLGKPNSRVQWLIVGGATTLSWLGLTLLITVVMTLICSFRLYAVEHRIGKWLDHMTDQQEVMP